MADKKEIVSEEKKPSLEEGNYIIEISSNGVISRRILAVKSAINIVTIQNDSLTIDLK